MAEPSDSNDSLGDPAEKGRLGFSRSTLSIVGLVIVLAFLIWVFLP